MSVRALLADLLSPFASSEVERPVPVESCVSTTLDTNGEGRGQIPANSGKANGFTLIEVMISLFIFALLSSAALALLTISADSENAARQKSAEISTLRRFTTILRQDMAQALQRPARDARGNPLPAFHAEDEVLAGLVRGGVQILGEGDAAGSSDIQRIEYRFEDNRLSRFAFAHVDGSEAGRETVIFDDVEDITMRYRLVTGQWQDDWRTENILEQPLAMEMTITRQGQAPLRIMTPVGTGYRR
ncbi:type II secretion system minor pseudopilin GspJ [Alterisphingorhabdus coralli]|uniref:Type II secretion system protein J n=1 Tax=Alterisphingorhabdus coralli TaxID=3071408 RepID=A0AA97F4Z5_9SPHN|nr:type II secretion system minor pseudopilin GspJ [Parasphingorhabdus sp. SCSIO 66989]WOE74321.1 type II secretion system minor pseudopilin GspJ [Parasphingorhabdus sp. SCSIO 66989]